MSVMSKRFSLLFFLKKQRKENDCQAIYLRVTVNGIRTEISTKRECAPAKWNAAAGRAKGTKEDIKALNVYLDLLQAKVYEAQHDLMTENKMVTGELIKNKIAGVEERPATLVAVFRQHNETIRQLIGRTYAKATWTKYETTLKHVQEFLKWKYVVSDMDIREIKYPFITDFEFFLQVEKHIDINTNGKYIKNLKKIVRECVIKGWLDKDPFSAYKVKHIEVEKPFLSAYELELLINKQFPIKRTELVKDLFLFSCYTGFSYIDARNLTPANIEIGVDGKKWICAYRQKTNIASRIPLLPPALVIIEKYRQHPQVCNKGKLLPMMSNQKVNSYLKEIADACGIGKEITFHTARHTFATTVTLSNGVPIESVSKMLGHKKLQTTQLYAKVLDTKVSNDMENLYNQLSVKMQETTIKIS